MYTTGFRQQTTLICKLVKYMAIKTKKNLTGSGTRLAVVLKNGKLTMGVLPGKTPKQAAEAKAAAKRILDNKRK
jgi:hypothetical protein